MFTYEVPFVQMLPNILNILFARSWKSYNHVKIKIKEAINGM